LQSTRYGVWLEKTWMAPDVLGNVLTGYGVTLPAKPADVEKKFLWVPVEG